MDFFLGSATTFQAAYQFDARLRVIGVQLPEVLTEENKEHLPALELLKKEKIKQGTIADISKERIRRAAKKIGAEAGASKELDLGFRVLKVDTSNMADVFYTPDAVTQADLLNHIDNIKPDRSPEDLLFQVMLDWGVDLALPIEKKIIEGKDVYLVDGNALAACFHAHGGIDDAFAKALAAHKPLRAVFRDAGFKSDDVKINIEQIFKRLSPGTDVKTL